jgi:sensor c-di-GMP phosphodiesterase-like protein
MRRQLPNARVAGAWLALMALPLALCLALSYGLSLYHFRNGAMVLSEANIRRIDDILRRGDATLAVLARTTGGECNEPNIVKMSQLVFQSMYFREAGIERNGQLQCTSVAMLPEPFAIENSRRKPAARIGAMEILSPTHTLQGGESIILNRPLRADRSHFVNLLLDPKVLAETVKYLEGVESAAFLDDSPNGRFILLENVPSPAIAALKPPFTPGLHRVAGGFYAVAHSRRYPVYTVTAVTDARVAEHWRTQAQPAVIAGFLLSGLALLMLRRFMPRTSEADDLRDGIAAGEMAVRYQPLVDARDRSIVGAEALVRWQHPRRGLVMPDEFIALAEHSDLITPLTRSVLHQVKRDLESLPDLPPGFRIGINLARAHLADEQLLSTLDDIFGPGKSLGQLGFEITERELLANIIDQARAMVLQLTERGAEVALDDFGTGYSGLSHLRSLPLHFIKIDRSFVWALDTEAVTASLVDSIVSLARSLGMGLIAEGVETDAQRELMLDIGVHLQQGWLYAEAVPLEQLRGLLAKGKIP